MSLNKEKWFYISILVFLWTAYFLYRSINGLHLISDENFYFSQDILLEKKRILFLSLVQSFSKVQAAQLSISFLNLFAILISYIYLSKINFNNYRTTFFQLIYFTAVASYVFRDSIILMLVILLFYIIFKQKIISNERFSKKFSFISFTLLVPILYLVLDLRPHYVLLVGASWVAASIFVKKPMTLFTLLLIVILAIFALFSFYPSLFNIYGISIFDFIGSMAERVGTDFTFYNSVIGFIKHYLAPLPTSLLDRIMDPSIWNDYGVLDDIYRVVYKTYLYFCICYILINYRTMKEVFKKWKFEAFLLLSFSLSNALVYTFISFGGGHERTKIFSVFFIFFIYSGILHIKKERSFNTEKIK